MQRRIASFGIVFFMGGLAQSCSRSSCRAKDPNQSLRDCDTAVRSGNAEAAWALLSEETKRSTTFEVFRAEFLRDPRQAQELADLMERPIGPPLVTAKLGVPNSEPVEMVQIGG